MVSAEGIESIRMPNFNDNAGPRMTPKAMEVNASLENRAQMERKRGQVWRDLIA
jgi:hypothetical protein